MVWVRALVVSAVIALGVWLLWRLPHIEPQVWAGAILMVGVASLALWKLIVWIRGRK
jgi:hypothetical protein